MYRKLLNKNSFRFLKGAFTENPIFFKKLNRKALFYNTLSNKRGLTDKIRKIQKNIITFNKKKNTEFKQSSPQRYNFIKSSFLNRSFLKFTKKVEKSKVYKYKYIFSYDMLKGEFYRKPSRHNKYSFFKTLLEERKKLCLIYGCLNKNSMQKIFQQAKKLQGKFDENFVKIVESRLDVALFRICFFPTFFSARQYVKYGHILVNNSVIKLPSYMLKAGDIITVAPDKSYAHKRKISLFIAKKIKIRPFHYLVKIKTFLRIIKSCIQSQKIQNLYSVNNQKQIFETKRDLQGLKYIKKRLFHLSILQVYKGLQNIVGKNTKKIKNLLKIFSFFSKKKDFRFLLPFLKSRNLFTSSVSYTQRTAAFKISGIKPLNIEVCYKKMVAIFLYSPQKVALPVSIDIQYIAKSVK